MQTSGVLLDVYDDCNGDVIRALFPSLSQIPSFVKQAHVLTAEERAQLPDDVFALVLQTEGGPSLRKYACVDEGNTALSVMYFLKNAHKLPPEAQKVAAANLATACSWYHLEDPGLEKAALAEAALRMASRHPFATLNAGLYGIPEIQTSIRAAGENHQAINAIRAVEGNLHGGRPISPEEMTEARFKGASVQKTARRLHPHVAVSNDVVTGPVREKKAAQYALRGQYPLDSYAQVKAASAYFDEYGKRFSPEDRREYCLQLVKRAEALGIEVGEDAQRYGATSWAPDPDLKVAHAARKQALTEELHVRVLEGIYEKRAEVEPELYAQLLSDFDHATGLAHRYDQAVPDPYYSTFGKTAEAPYSEIVGNDMITEETLKVIGNVGFTALRNMFGEDFAVEFTKDPVGIFKSLPRDQKVVIMRSASGNTSAGNPLSSRP